MMIMRRTIINKPNEKADSGRRKKKGKKKDKNTEEKLKTIIERVGVCLSEEAMEGREGEGEEGSQDKG